MQVPIILRVLDFSLFLSIYHCFYQVSQKWIFNIWLNIFYDVKLYRWSWKASLWSLCSDEIYYLGFTEKFSLFVLFGRCEELGLVERCQVLDVRKAEDSELLTVHTEALVDQLRQTDGCLDLERLEKLSSNYDAVYIHPVGQLIIH